MTKLPLSAIRSLNALGFQEYANDKEFFINDVIEVKQLILRLEKTKIRLFSIKEREPLELITPDNHAKWYKAFMKYLNALGITVHQNWNWDNTEQRMEIICRLISYAIHDEYLDGKEDGTLLQDSMYEEEEHTDIVVISPEVLQAVNDLLKYCTLPTLPIDKITPPMFKSALSAVQSRVIAAHLPPSSNTIDPNTLNLPIACKTNNAAIQKYCTVLRMLHVQNLGVLQHYINDVIAQMQTATANPITDSRQGRIGR